MFNWIKKYIEELKQKKQEKIRKKMRRQLIQLFVSFGEAERHSLLFLDVHNRRVLISDLMVGPFAHNDKAWRQFFQNLGYWFRYRVHYEHWNMCRIFAGNAALKEARKNNPDLTKDEVRLIRAKASLEMEYDESRVPSFDGYEFCICDGILRSDVKAEVVGVWKDGEIEINFLNRV